MRGELATEAEGALPLDGFFALNRAMPELHSRFRIGEALILHAAATPYRGRSHYEGQAALESGISGGCKSGWLNRAAAALARAGSVPPRRLLAVGASAPLIVRGSAPTLVCAPAVLRFADSERLARLVDPHGVEEVQVAAAGSGAGKDERMRRSGIILQGAGCRDGGSACRCVTEHASPPSSSTVGTHMQIKAGMKVAFQRCSPRSTRR